MGMSSQKGFTLMEVIITCGIITMLVAIALPSYRQHVVKTHRVQAQACLVNQANVLERHYTRVLDYQGAPVAHCAAEIKAYQVHVELAPGGYTVVATPVSGHADHACGPLGLDQAGRRSPADTACW
ncbi:type IV pilin protein [Stenotrophomonas sp. 24(2023)]|uniref:type IV pilin protein n=1 Tax=Stenotrophomonas sp. 24(2023) TaxID=3068324 RepID=UPI0027E14DD6|nr:type IV pilin protein [Stenotrophomonas sp. 24(2023)]WMJ70938.1 type IV pilin protein [Stenotrophomonas sp. 24(2023)]